MRIWFNQAYRGTFQLIALLRQGCADDGLPLEVVGSHTVRSTPFLQACDEAFPEPEHLVGEEWVERALEVCAQRRVDVFVPVRERLAVAQAADRFAAAGVRLMVSPPEALRVLGDKARAHESAQALGVPVPRTHVVTDAAGFRAAYDDLRAWGLGACVKPVDDHGAQGFRVLDETVGGFEDLLMLPSPRVHPDDVERRITARGTVAPLLVAEHLDGDELSVDVLSRDGRVLAAVPRSKGGPPWTRLLVDDPQALAITRAMSEGHGLRYLSNVQVRYGADGVCRLLEVNTRAASGLFHSAASGLNLPHLALRLLLNGEVEVPEPRFGATVLTWTEAAEVVLPF
ncbi:MAG: ATP-grasp domain-containing protein [Actinomycetota bacterium]|nr:ATP-grasp domain-containing protein [Actinomycetota bacterium]